MVHFSRQAPNGAFGTPAMIREVKRGEERPAAGWDSGGDKGQFQIERAWSAYLIDKGDRVLNRRLSRPIGPEVANHRLVQ